MSELIRAMPADTLSSHNERYGALYAEYARWVGKRAEVTYANGFVERGVVTYLGRDGADAPTLCLRGDRYHCYADLRLIATGETGLTELE